MSTNSNNRLVISTMKNEGPYILEWLAYYRAIGFTDFLVYSNDCTDGSDLLLDRLADLGYLVHERNRVLRRGPHKSALKYAMAHEEYAAAEWVFVCDSDEFLNIRVGDGRVDDLIAAFPDADAIPVTWKLFSNNGEVTLRDDLSLAMFTDGEKDMASGGQSRRFVKTLFRRRDDLVRLGLHAPVFPDGVDVNWGSLAIDTNPEDDPIRPATVFGYEVAQVNHYAVRSVESYLLKRDRGRANHTGDTLGLEYWLRWCLGGQADTSILRHLDAVLDELAGLRADPIVQHLHQGTVAWHKQRVAALLNDPDYVALRDELSSMQTPKVTPVAENEALRVKAPKRHANRLKMLERMPKGGRCAEIGVWNGGFSASILDVTAPSELILIDPWDLLSAQPKDEMTHGRHEDSDFMAEMFGNVRSRYGALPNVKIRKGFSAEELETFPDDYFDWVYIDGNHLYDFVLKDLEVSFRKVRKGGIIAGDDFFWKKDGRTHVKDAVLDAIKQQGRSKHDRMGQQFLITVDK